jgi:hypothetical protein
MAGVVACAIVIYVTAGIALQRADVLRLGRASASELTADYSADPRDQGTRPRLDPAIVAAAARDERAFERAPTAATSPTPTSTADNGSKPATKPTETTRVTPGATSTQTAVTEPTSTRTRVPGTPTPTEVTKETPTPTLEPKPTETSTPEAKPTSTVPPSPTRTQRPCRLPGSSGGGSNSGPGSAEECTPTPKPTLTPTPKPDCTLPLPGDPDICCDLPLDFLLCQESRRDTLSDEQAALATLAPSGLTPL